MPVSEVGLKEYIIGLLPVVLQLAILVAIVRRELLKDLRWFFSYTLFQILVTAIGTVEFAIKVSDLTYFYTFYIAELFSITLALCVIYEVFGSVLRPYDGEEPWWKALFIRNFCVGSCGFSDGCVRIGCRDVPVCTGY